MTAQCQVIRIRTICQACRDVSGYNNSGMREQNDRIALINSQSHGGPQVARRRDRICKVHVDHRHRAHRLCTRCPCLGSELHVYSHVPRARGARAGVRACVRRDLSGAMNWRYPCEHYTESDAPPSGRAPQASSPARSSAAVSLPVATCIGAVSLHNSCVFGFRGFSYRLDVARRILSVRGFPQQSARRAGDPMRSGSAAALPTSMRPRRRCWWF